MKIIYGQDFKFALNNLLAFIAERDGVGRAINFRNELLTEIERIYPMPCRFRKDKTLNDESVRDLIFKGYVIPFQIYDDKIEILALYKENIWKGRN